jgi:hypothetical protein
VHVVWRDGAAPTDELCPQPGQHRTAVPIAKGWWRARPGTLVRRRIKSAMARSACSTQPPKKLALKWRCGSALA